MKKGIRHYVNRIKSGRLREMRMQIKWIYQYARQNWLGMIFYTVLGLSATVVSLISGLISKDLVDIITGRETGQVVLTFCMMIGMNIGNTFLNQISGYLSNKININVDNKIKADVFEKILVTDWESLTGYHTGDLLMRWNSDASQISGAILNLIPNLIVYTVRFISALAMVVYYDATFAIFSLCSIPISLLLSRRMMKKMKKTGAGSMSLHAKMSGFNQEAFSNIQTIKAFDMIPLYVKRLKQIQQEYKEMRMNYQKVSMWNSLLMTILSMCVSYAAYGWGIYRVWSGAITYGTMTMFLGLSATLTTTVTNLLNMVPSALAITISAQRLMDVLNMPREDYSGEEEVKALYEQNKDRGIGIRVSDALYAYRNGNEVFEGASIEAHPHEIVALVGPSGEGKTTMLRLLLALLRPVEGEVSLFTKEEKLPMTAAARMLFSYVPQGNTMFSGTIAENMRNVKEDATDEEIVEALKMACAWEFVEKLPDGIESVIKERGGGFSEGQAQRLSIARALLRKSPLLLLDEATSALDVATERRVLKNIMEDTYPRTCIVTTHRPTVLNLCNRVYAIRDKQCSVLSEEEISEMLALF